MQNKTETYIITWDEGPYSYPVYIYEVDARKAETLEQATHFEVVEKAKEMCTVLNSLAALQETLHKFSVKKVQNIISEVE